MARAAMGKANERFGFGKNWSNFLEFVNDERIEAATDRLRTAVQELKGKSFLDIGCGSGIHSLAAVRLGASRVHSFDYDQDSVNCALELKRRFTPSSAWKVEQGSALDENYIRSLGRFDVVYSWGVLHHTGNMWKALELATIPVADCLMVAIYNDQGNTSRRWQNLKRLYNSGPALTRTAIEIYVWYEGWGQYFLRDLVTLRPTRTLRQWKSYE